MKLESIRELKQQLLAAPQTLAQPMAAAESMRTFSRRTEMATRALGRIALGAAPAKDGYRLAIRQQQSGPLVAAATEEIKRLAKGEVDVQYVGRIAKQVDVTKAAYYRRRRRPLKIGSSIGDVPNGFIAAGTLGCFVISRAASRYFGILTINHVIAGENSNRLGDPIVQQGTLDGGKAPDDVIGELGKVIKLKATGINRVDAAFGILYEGIDVDVQTIGNLGKLNGEEDVANLPEKATVYKVGRTTGQTKGRVTAFDLDNILVEYDIGVARFDGQIEIEGTGKRSFSDAGDSGSLIVDADLNAIGLLFAGGDEGGTNNKGFTYANPIAAVLDALEVDIDR
jgi:hypothetical protein